ncbi:MAG: multidrug transporter [Ruminococcus sp.]
MKFSEIDWKLFRKMLPDWQERYMERLNQSYAELLNSEMDPSDKFWTLERRIRKDKQCPGVIVRDMSRSQLYDIIIQLMVDGVICEQDLQDFSEELRDSVTRWFQFHHQDYEV